MFTGYNKQKEILIYKNLANSGMTEHITLTLSMSQKNIWQGKRSNFFGQDSLWFEYTEYGSFEKEFISLFEQFEKDYPKSEYSKYIKPYIDNIISYHQIIEQPFAPDMLFMENYKTVNTLEEAIKPFLGKKIYIGGIYIP